MRVLIIEDDPAFRSILIPRLRAVGKSERVGPLEISIAETVAEGRRLLTQAPAYTLVISDYRLPDGTGSELVPLATGPFHLVSSSPATAPGASDKWDMLWALDRLLCQDLKRDDRPLHCMPTRKTNANGVATDSKTCFAEIMLASLIPPRQERP